VIKPTILIVEDEFHLREILSFQLEGAGFAVIHAEDGQQGVQLATEHHPDLVLLDVMMPGFDGYEVCRRLRSSFATRDIPIIMLTAKTTEDEKVTGLENGANDYVTKPWQQRELMLRIRNVLEWSRQQRSASPLTGLPGNLSINDEIARRLSGTAPFALLQIDIDHFKSFNDYYGYARGDDAIKRLAEILVRSSSEHGGTANFVGHIGGDDFVVVSVPEHAVKLGDAIVVGFDEAVPALYDEEDRKKGYVEVRNRRHALERFPLMSVTIALISTDQTPVSHLAHLIDVAQELKAHGKGIPGSILVNERRRPDDPPEAERSVA
jgi:DNA-binding response OmpR family regulator